MLHVFLRMWALLVLLTSSCVLSAQTVNSSCGYDPNFYAQYANGTWSSVYASMNTQDSLSFLSQPALDQNLHNTIMGCIAAVYNTSLPARDTVVNKLQISQFAPIDLLRIEVKLDTSHAWTIPFLNGMPSGTSNPYVNNLSQQYGFAIENIEWAQPWVTTHDATVRIKILNPHNTTALARMLATQNGVAFASAVTPSGDGNQIIYQRINNENVITFRYGWSTCPAGCESQRDWRFIVYPDCSVQYVGSYGDMLLAQTDLFKIGSLNVFPIPANHAVQIEVTQPEASGQYLFTLTDMGGRQVYRTQLELFANQAVSIPVTNLANGTYVLQVQNAQYKGVQKITVLK
jgi:Secretion system C-terminal sorting domain